MSINLLPWREIKRQAEHKQRIRWIVLSLFAGFSIILTLRFYTDCLFKKQMAGIQNKQAEIRLLESQMAQLNKQKQRQQAMIKQREHLKKLLSPDVSVVQALNDLVNALPETATVTLLQYHGRYLKIYGLARSEDGVFQFMKKLQENAWLQRLVLKNITKMLTEGLSKVSRFQMLITLAQSSDHD